MRLLLCVLLLLLQLGHGRSPAAELYGLEITNNGPITTGAQATIQASLRMENKNVTSNLYHFNWIYAPLILIEKSEQRFNSIINVTGEFPGTFPVSVWVTHRNCWLCRPVARNVTVLQITEFITGNLTIAQIEDRRVTTHGSRSSTDTVTRISFSLHDPSHYFKSASFIYNWDFGDGVYQITKEPFVYCNCSSTGNRTVHLKVVAEWEQIGSIIHEREIMQKTGDFTTALELLGDYEAFRTFNPVSIIAVYVQIQSNAVKSINIVGSRETQVMENLNLSLHINGTPPLALCWLIKSECIPLEGDKCHLVEISGSCYNLSHTFRDAGQYCLSVRVENGVTMLQTYHGIKVRPAVTPAGSPMQGHTCPSWVPKPSGRVVRWPSEENGGEPGCDTDWSHRVTVSQLCTDRAAHSRRHWCAFRAESSVLEALSCCGGIHPAFFVLLCTALVSVMLVLVLYTTFRSNTQQKDLVEVADFDFSPLSDEHRSNHSKSGCGLVCCRSCFLQPSKEAAWESHELLHSLYKPVKMYTL